MVIDLRVVVPAVLVTLGCVVLVTVRLALAPGPTPRKTSTAYERGGAASMILVAEPGWTAETTQNFPSDQWSQRDDFHGREYKKAIEVANERGMRIEDVLRGVDDDIHRRAATSVNATDTRNARAIPCKPRPFYD